MNNRNFRRSNANRYRPRVANRKVADESYNGWTNWDTWNAYGVITSDYDDYQKGIAATKSGNPLDLIPVFQNSVYLDPDINIADVDWDEIYFALEEDTDYTANHRANRKTADESHNGWTNYETWYIKAIIDNDYDLYKKSRSRSVGSTDRIIELVRFHPLNDLSDSDMQKVNWEEILEDLVRERNELNGYTSHRANRKIAGERMDYGTVYVVTSDGEVVEGETPGDMEYVSVHAYADDQPEVGYYDFEPIIDELYEGVVSSTGGAEPVEVVPGYFIGDMGISTDEIAKFGPGEYRLCPVSLSFWVGDGEFGDLEYDDGFSYDVVIRY